jgi:acyl carrier protein
MIKTDISESQILEKFSQLVAKSLHIESSQVTPDIHLDELGAESLDLIEITMETESQFHIFLPDKSILDTAMEVFGPGVLEKDGYLTEEGKRLMRRRMPEADAEAFTGEVSVNDLKRYFLKVSTWIRMIESLMEHTPQSCATCGGPMVASMGFRIKCSSCGQEVTLRSGEEINREWVEQYRNEVCRSEKIQGSIQSAAQAG